MSRHACAVPDLTMDTVIMTGGITTMQVVSMYDMQGHLEDLPQLIVGRYWHGCGSYLRLDGTQVKMAIILCPWWMWVLVGHTRSWWLGWFQPTLIYRGSDH